MIALGSCLTELQSLSSEQPSKYTSKLHVGVFPSILVHCSPGIRQVVLDFFVLIDELYSSPQHLQQESLLTFPSRTC